MTLIVLLQGCVESDEEVRRFSIGGTVDGLTGIVVLKNSGGELKSIYNNGDFTLVEGVESGASYNVSVLFNPSGQGCVVENSAGVIGGANIINIRVKCVNDVNPQGYYHLGKLNINNWDLKDENLQAMIYDGRMFLVSITNSLLYEGVEPPPFQWIPPHNEGGKKCQDTHNQEEHGNTARNLRRKQLN